MRLGLSLPSRNPDGSPLTGEGLVENARRIEAAGFDSIWCFDSIGRGNPSLDPLIAVSVVAAVTDRITVGTGILQVPLRNPVELAHRVLTAHLVCRGRLLLGVGAGSTEGDFEAVGLAFADRMRRFEQGLAIMRRVWKGDPFDGGVIQPHAAALGGPPVLIGSWSGATWIPRAAREFDGWIGSALRTNAQTLAAGIARYRAEGGKRAIVTNIQVDLSAPTRPMGDGPFDLRCAPEEAAARLQHLARLGFDEAVLVHHSPKPLDPERLRALLPP